MSQEQKKNYSITVRIPIILSIIVLSHSQNTKNCPTGNYLSPNNTCSPCSNSCQSCNDGFSCLTCKPSFHFTSNRCEACPLNCQSCSKASTCNICKTGYLYSNTTKMCIWFDCAEVYCLSCNSGKNYSVCGLCADGYMLIGTLCVTCTYGCQKCTNNTCQTCVAGKYLSGNSCLQCISNCVTCKDNGTCEICSTDYSFNPQSKKCQIVQSSATDKLLITMIPIQVGLILLTIVIICIYKWRKNQDNPNPEEDVPGSLSRLEGQEIEDEKSEKRNQLLKQECPICLQQGCEAQTSCKHHFHLKCLLSWKMVKKNCPSCRQTDYFINTICKKCQHKVIKLPKNIKQALDQVCCQGCSSIANPQF